MGEVAERVGYSINPLNYLLMFSAVCAKTAWLADYDAPNFERLYSLLLWLDNNPQSNL